MKKFWVSPMAGFRLASFSLGGMVLLWGGLVWPFCFQARGSEVDEWEEGVMISERLNFKWKRGRYLIYDCVDKHYACVDRASFMDCQKNRVLYRGSQGLNGFDQYCAPLKEWPKAVECFRKQQELIDRVEKKAFCIKRKGVGSSQGSAQ